MNSLSWLRRVRFFARIVARLYGTYSFVRSRGIQVIVEEVGVTRNEVERYILTVAIFVCRRKDARGSDSVETSQVVLGVHCAIGGRVLITNIKTRHILALPVFTRVFLFMVFHGIGHTDKD